VEQMLLCAFRAEVQQHELPSDPIQHLGRR
jgi:hypothetical protein